MKKLILITTGVLLFAAKPLIAQTVVRGNVNTWALLLNRFYLSEKFTITNELHERTGDFFEDQGTFIFRPSLDYAPNEHIEYSVGYSYIRSTPYSPYSLPIARNEHNIWEQAFLKSKIGKVKIQHRFRLEHRFVENITVRYPSVNPLYEIDGSNFSNRFRYRFVLSFDIAKVNKKKHTIFFNFFDEMWINQSDNLMPTTFARNWIYTGLGYRFNKDCNIQLAHMHQYDAIGNDTYISSSIIQLSVFKNFDLKRKPVKTEEEMSKQM